MVTVHAEQHQDDGLYHFNCPQCNQHYKGGKDFLNTNIKCVACHCTFLIAESHQERILLQKNEAIDFSNEVIEGNIVCPHCWNTFSAEHVLRISSHPDLMGDPVLGPLEQRRFSPVIFNADGTPLDDKNVPSPDMACPHCRLLIPESIVKSESIYISVVGAPSSGKSYFLTVLVHELRKTLPERIASSFFDVDPRINKTLNEYEDQIYMATDKSKVVSLRKTELSGKDFTDQTVLHGLPVNLPKPFIFQQIDSSAEISEESTKNIVFYDNAGEHFQPGADSISNPSTLHLVHSDAIFFIFDPLLDPGMRTICNPLDPQISEHCRTSNQTTLFSEMVNRIRLHGKHSGVAPNKPITTPLFVLVGKYDTWEDYFDFDVRHLVPFQVNQETCSVEYDDNMVVKLSYSVRELLLRYAPGIVAQAEACFANVLFLPTSNFGYLAQVSAGSENAQSTLGVLPEKLSSIWVDIPYYAAMNHYGKLQRIHSLQEKAIPLTGRVENDKLLFLHPKTKLMVRIPATYAGRCIVIDNQEYCLPGIGHINEKCPRENTDYWR